MALDHPLVQSVILPLAVTLILTALIRRMAGPGHVSRWMALPLGAALLTAHTLVLGVPEWPPRSGLQKLPLIITALLAGGLLLDRLRLGRAAAASALIAALAVLGLWLAWPQLGGADRTTTWLLPVVYLAAIAGLTGLERAPADGAHRPAMVVVGALGLAGASLNAGSLALFQSGLALAAATGGAALWNWPRPRVTFGAGALAVAGLTAAALALLLLLLTRIAPWALLPLPFVFAASALARRLPAPRGLSREVIEPVYIVLIGALPAALTVLLAAPVPATDDLYYR